MSKNPQNDPGQTKEPGKAPEPPETLNAAQGTPGEPQEGVEKALAVQENPTKPDTEAITPEVVDQEREDQDRTRIKKKLFLEVLSETMGNIKQTCQTVDISRQTFYDWRHSDPDFRKALLDVEAGIIEDAEGVLGALIRRGDGPSVRFLLQTRSDKYKPKSRLEVIPGSADGLSFEDEVDALAKKLYFQRTGKEYVDGRDNEGRAADADRGEAANTEQAQGDSTLPPEHGAAVLLEQGQAPQPDTQS